MAEIRGIVVKKQGERAEIKVDKTESELKGLPKYLDCWNPVGAKIIMYGLPVAGVLAGLAFGNSLAVFFHMEKWPFLIGGVILWEIVTISYAHIFKRDAVRQGKQPVIFEIQAEEMVIDMSKK